DVLAPGRGKKCSLCTKILGKVKAMAGEDPDEAAVAAALSKCCGARAGPWGRLCRRLLRKYRDRIGAALRDGRDPRAVCAAIGLCRA
ncbi:NKL protein, partial [Podargus strigoides]|nr:NKL protein [Podargus strigoides]